MLINTVSKYRSRCIPMLNIKNYSYSNSRILNVISSYNINYRLCEYSNEPTDTGKLAKAITPELNTTKPKVLEEWSDIALRWYKKYQDFVGISEILQAQERVSMLTNHLLEVQSKRRQLQREVEDLHQQLLAIHQRITKSELYSEDHYSLFEKARQLNGSLKSLQTQFIQAEEEERSLFTQLSTAIQFCHDKERTHSEQSKYWSILISVISASLAALITSINNWVRIKEIKDHASLLHKDIIDRTNQLQAVFSNSLQGVGESTSQEALIQSLQTTVHDEVQQLLQSANDNPEEGVTIRNIESSHYEDVSYIKIAGSMLSGALLGIIITYNFLTPSAGGS